MKQIEVFYGSVYRTIPQKVERTLQWYDIVKKEMMFFKGGRLKFKYQLDEYLEKLPEEERLKLGFKVPYRLLPEVEDVTGKTTVFKSNKDDFDKWFYNYLKRADSDILKREENNTNAVFNIPDDEFEDFISELEYKDFDYNEI